VKGNNLCKTHTQSIDWKAQTVSSRSYLHIEKSLSLDSIHVLLACITIQQVKGKVISWYAEIFLIPNYVSKHALPRELNYKKLNQLTSCYNNVSFISIPATQVCTHNETVVLQTWLQLFFFLAVPFCVSFLFVENVVPGEQVIRPVHQKSQVLFHCSAINCTWVDGLKKF